MNKKNTLPFRPKALSNAAARLEAEAENVMRELNQAVAQLSNHERINRNSLENAISRAGEMRMTAAAPLLIRLIGSGSAWRDYCIAWALGWCNDESAVLPLARITEDTLRPPYVRHIAREALMKLFDDSIRTSFQLSVMRQLPSCLRELAARGSADSFRKVLAAYLEEEPQTDYAIFDLLYQLNTERVRPALLSSLRQLEPNAAFPDLMQRFYASALYRRDAETLGLVAARLEQAQTSDYANSCQALSKRLWRALQKLSQSGEAIFANQVIQYWLDASGQPKKPKALSRLAA